MAQNKKEVLFIATNVPEPNNSRGNEIIVTIAKQLSSSFNITFFKPKVWVPFGLHLLKKYRRFYEMKDFVLHGFKIHIIPYVEIPGLKFTYYLFNRIPKKAKALFEEKQYDLIHAHYGMPDGYLAYMLSKKYGVPYVLTLRSHDLRHLEKLKRWNLDYKKYYSVLSNASCICVTNSYLLDYFKKIGFETTILPHGIDVIYSYKSDFTNEVVTITCVSQYLKRKNIEWVIDAVFNYRGGKRIQLDIIGDCRGLPQDYVKKCVNGITLKGRMPKEQVIEHLIKSDIFALPSVRETFGLVYLEAAACGNAIIGHKDEGVCGVFEEETEMLFINDYNSFCDTLYALVEDKNLRKSLAVRAHKKAESFTWDKVVERYATIYNACK